MSSTADVIREARARTGLTQRELAQRAGTSQPAVARLESARATATVGTLERLLAAAGFDLNLAIVPRPGADPVTAAFRAGVDRTLLRENLRRSVDGRLRSLAELHDAGRELERATTKARRQSRGRA